MLALSSNTLEALCLTIWDHGQGLLEANAMLGCVDGSAPERQPEHRTIVSSLRLGIGGIH